MKLAFIGFRHPHILALYDLARDHASVEIVAACEDDAATRQRLATEGIIALTHGDYHQMLHDVTCDAVAVGDYYSRRGEIILTALRQGKHVLSDKPLCTRLDQLDQIATVASQKGLSIGCMLDLRDLGNFCQARRLIHNGSIGQVHTVCFTGQHPLRYGSRPDWYFQGARQGGTLNDLAIHAMDLIPWMTGHRIVQVVAARAWNARLSAVPHFQDAAQLMLRLDNGGGIIGDVSYLAPDTCGYAAPQYWRITFHGSKGMLETSMADRRILLAASQDESVQVLESEKDTPGGYLESFLKEISGQRDNLSPSTPEILRASRIALTVQLAADNQLSHLPL